MRTHSVRTSRIASWRAAMEKRSESYENIAGQWQSSEHQGRFQASAAKKMGTG